MPLTAYLYTPQRPHPYAGQAGIPMPAQRLALGSKGKGRQLA